MAGPVSSSPSKSRLRLIYMSALADSYKILCLMGSELGPRMLGVMWSPEVMGGFYGQYLSSAADQILDASPELGELLSSDDWESTVMAPYYARVQDQINQQIAPGQLEEFRSNLGGAVVDLMDQLKGIKVDGKSPLGDSLEVDVDTVALEPSRLRELFSPKDLGHHTRELGQLEDALGIYLFQGADDFGAGQFAQAILPHLLQISTSPQSVELPKLRRDSPVWDWLGIPKHGVRHDGIYAGDFEPIVGLCKLLGQQRHRQQLVRYMLARILRNEYGLNRGRKVLGETWQDLDGSSNSGSLRLDSYRDTAAEAEFAGVENQALLEELLAVASPAHREAVQVYWEAAKSGNPLAEICRSLGRDPNVVRNNFQAFRRKVKAKFTDF
jgi:hypothetical protein